jgi:hypothetical protein
MDVSRIGLIKSLSDSQLVEMSRKQDKPDEALFALGELGRRNDRREAVAMQMGKAPTIADQEREKAMMQEPMMQEPMMQEPVMMAAGGGLVNQGIGAPPINPDMISPDMIAGIGSPDMMPQPQPIGSGVGQLPAPMMMAAGGGLIELAGGGEIIPYQNEGLVEGEETFLDRWLGDEDFFTDEVQEFATDRVSPDRKDPLLPLYDVESEDYIPYSEQNWLQEGLGFFMDSPVRDLTRGAERVIREDPEALALIALGKGLGGVSARQSAKSVAQPFKNLADRFLNRYRKRRPDSDPYYGSPLRKGKIDRKKVGRDLLVGGGVLYGGDKLLSGDETPQEGTAITSPVPSPNELMRERLQGMKTTAEEEAAKEAERKELAESGIAATLADKGIGAETILELGLRMMGDKDTTGGVLGSVGRAGTVALTNAQARKEKAAERASEDKYRQDIVGLKKKAIDTDLQIASSRMGWKPKDVSDQFFEFSQSPEAAAIRKNIKKQFDEYKDIPWWPFDRDEDDIRDKDGNTLGQAQELALLQGFRRYANRISGISGGANFLTQLNNEIRSRASE